MDKIIQGKDFRYTAFGRYCGRPFIADGESLAEAQEGRQTLKDDAVNKAVFPQRRFKAKPNEQYNLSR